MSDHADSLYDTAGRWRPWEPQSFDAPAPEEPDHAEAAQSEDATPALPDPNELLAEIERLREAAKARGYAEGYAAGNRAGQETGLAAGHEQGLQEGRETGYAEGYTQGRDAAAAEVEKLDAVLQACADAIGALEAETGEALLGLALSIARQVLRSTLDAEPQRILDLIREVVHVDGGPQGLLKLRLNPADTELVDQYLREDGTVSRWSLHADDSIERGGCIVETALGSIDATLQTRWERVVSGLGTKP